MATDKRERQRANREQKQAQLAKQNRRRNAIQLVKRWSLIAAGLIVLFVAAGFLFGN